MESLVMNYFDEEELPPETEDDNLFKGFICKTLNPGDQVMQENIIHITDTSEKIFGEFASNPIAILPNMLTVIDNMKNESSENYAENYDDVEVLSDEDNSDPNTFKDVISSIVITKVETVVEDHDACSSNDKKVPEVIAVMSSRFSSAEGAEIKQEYVKEESQSTSSTSDKENSSGGVNKLDVSKQDCSRDDQADGEQTNTAAKRSENDKQITKLSVFKCELCPYSSTIRFALKRHLLTHSENSLAGPNRLKCLLCSYECKSKKSLFYHSLNAHKNHNMKCQTCNKTVPAYMKDEHLSRCSEKSFGCNTVRGKKRFLWPRVRSKIETHNESVKLENKKQLYSCQFCSYTTSIEGIFNRHNRLHTSRDKRIYPCSKCDYKSTKKELKQHLEESHAVKPKPTVDQDKFKCEFCSFTSRFLQCLKKHRPLHTTCNKPNTSCKKCDYQAPKVTLQYHYKTIHGSSNKAQRARTDGLNLRENEQSQKTDKYSCDLCSFTTNSSDISRKHQRSHVIHKKRIYQCSKCDYKAFNLEVTKHVRLAHKVPLKRCQFCSFTTKYDNNLKRHMELHTVSKKPNVRCVRCSYKAPKTTVFHHYRKVHRVKLTREATLQRKTIYGCDKCNYKSTKYDVSRHKNTIHKVTSNIDSRTHKLSEVNLNPKKAVKQLLTHNKTKPAEYNRNNVAKHKKQAQQQGQKHKCNNCSYVAPFDQCLRKHLKLHARGEPILSCSECDYKSTNINVKNHMRKVHTKPVVKQQILKYECDVCSFTTRFAHSLQRHFRWHTSKELVTNLNVGKNEKSISTISDETLFASKPTQPGKMNVKQDEITFTSNYKTFKSDVNKNDIREYSAKAEPIPDVPSKSDSSGPIDIVESVYSGRINDVCYVCEICEYTTSVRDTLIKHKLTHLNTNWPSLPKARQMTNDSKREAFFVNNNILKCSECSRNFFTINGFACHVCEQDTDQYTVQVNEGSVTFKCKSCAFVTFIKAKIQRHCNSACHRLEN